MVWSGNGVTYTELRQMDLAEYQECRQAKRLWVEPVSYTHLDVYKRQPLHGE